PRVVRDRRHLVRLEVRLGLFHHREGRPRPFHLDPCAVVAGPSHARHVLGAEEKTVAPKCAEPETCGETLIRRGIVGEQRGILAHARLARFQEERTCSLTVKRRGLELRRHRNALSLAVAVALVIERVRQDFLLPWRRIRLFADADRDLLVECERESENYRKHQVLRGGGRLVPLRRGPDGGFGGSKCQLGQVVSIPRPHPVFRPTYLRAAVAAVSAGVRTGGITPVVARFSARCWFRPC